MSDTIKCPFCHEGNFDLIGLKNHFEDGGCDAYNRTLSIEEESALRKLKKNPSYEDGDEELFPPGCDRYGSLDD